MHHDGTLHFPDVPWGGGTNYKTHMRSPQDAAASLRRFMDPNNPKTCSIHMPQPPVWVHTTKA